MPRACLTINKNTWNEGSDRTFSFLFVFSREDNNKPNHVLLFTIINPVYPITVVSVSFYLTNFVKFRVKFCQLHINRNIVEITLTRSVLLLEAKRVSLMHLGLRREFIRKLICRTCALHKKKKKSCFGDCTTSSLSINVNTIPIEIYLPGSKLLKYFPSE